MIPFLESAGGSSQEAKMLVEVWEATVKLTGAKEGTRNNKKYFCLVLGNKISSAVTNRDWREQKTTIQ